MGIDEAPIVRRRYGASLALPTPARSQRSPRRGTVVRSYEYGRASPDPAGICGLWAGGGAVHDRARATDGSGTLALPGTLTVEDLPWEVTCE
ncbi:hypothetical protein PA7_25820 [Pseudonocardia asaccharolytica DSM 44247 = NBRC 16224]|uniref:Uncharacterized protein n=1 Tax=Pseudonocardia asaccharolytica DSM 44247 = NBRC 16224 TaxID=1123024 RepID=A0A511D1U5_9PSEU|nr:hypothetical protein PA7_25820 [Pseudonocardia asaccharolytica DSM 44247 = NBRC 16224]